MHLTFTEKNLSSLWFLPFCTFNREKQIYAEMKEFYIYQEYKGNFEMYSENMRETYWCLVFFGFF